MSRRPRRDEDGYTLVEALVVALITSLVMALVATILVSSQDALTRTTEAVAVDSRARGLLLQAEQDLRSATPLGACQEVENAYGTPFDQCPQPAAYVGFPSGAGAPGGPVAWVDPSDLWFYSYARPGTSGPPSSTFGTCPYVEHLWVDNGELRLDVFASSASATWTTPSWPDLSWPSPGEPPTAAAPSFTFQLGAVTSADIFVAKTATGADTTDASQVAEVAISPTFAKQQYAVSDTVAIPAAAYNGEQRWYG